MVRTALFNWAYARHTGGTFIFRIEDTDDARDSEESYELILESMRWLGLLWDEGVDVGGPHGPYRQSERSDIYEDIVQRLLDAGYLYESFSTAEEIDARNEAAGRPKQLGYDNFDRNLSDEEKAAFRAEGRQPALRFRVPDIDLSFTDLVRGDIAFAAGSTIDFVVVRPNGKPLYTLTNPVDDALMGVTHVLRGEDLLSSTPRQIALHMALVELGIEASIPQFGHLPYVLGDGNKKLSKRDPQSNLLHHRARGFIPEGLLNYLSLLGWSIAPDRDVFTLEEMVQVFDVHDVNPNPARFDQKKADAINADHLRRLDVTDFAERVIPYLTDAGVLPEQPSEEQLQRLHAAAPLVQSRMTVLSESVGLLGFLYREADEIEYEADAMKSLGQDAPRVLEAGFDALSGITDEAWQTETIQDALQRALIDGLELKPRFAFGPIRVAVSGRRVSPPLFESLEILGRDESLKRIQRLSSELGAV